MDYGPAKIQTGNFKIIHDIDLRQYDKIISELTHTLRHDVPNDNSLYPYLEHELYQVTESLGNLKPQKTKRSLDFIGSAWKWIAGNPDHEDFLTIKLKMNNLLENNNNQLIINKLLTDRINNITTITNKIIKLAKNDNESKQEFINSIQYKLKLIKEELLNINLAISFAKSGIINTMMLSKKEIKLATDILDKEKLPYNTPEEALEFADVKIVTNSLSLLYIINVPITTNEIYEKLLLKPVKNQNSIIEINQNFILRKNNIFYLITKICKNYNKLSICNQIDLLNISNSTCIPNILKSSNSTCNKINNPKLPTLEELTPGILLVNDFYGEIDINNVPRNLNGTFLIKFSNATISINGQTFTTHETPIPKALPPIFQPTPQEKEYRDLLSLETMQILHINNTKHIQLLETRNQIDRWTNYGLIITLVIVFAIALVMKLPIRRKTEIIIKPQSEEGINSKMSDANLSMITIPSFFEHNQL